VCSRLKEGRPVYPDTFPIRRPDRRPKQLAVQAGYYCLDTGTPLYKGAYVAARASVDTALTAADEILAGRALAYAVCRPPGHHAGKRFFGGFCYFNNAAIAAQRLANSAKVAVLDLDFHHGNGTQDIFYEREDVLTVSVHGHPDHAYPYFSGFESETGEGAGLGSNRNFPLPAGTEGDRYLRSLDSALEIIDRAGSEVIVLSLGFDVMRGDPTGTFALSSDVMRRIGARLVATGLPLLVVQEGGYNLRNIRSGSAAFFRGCAEAHVDG
jgi:acetoin utilization deacetylase AcuC-like enzyme